MEFLGDSNNPSAVDVVSFVREVMEKFPELRQSVLEKLLDTFMDMKSGKVFRGALWIIGEYCLDAKEIDEAWARIREAIGEIPILASEQRLLEATEEDEEKPAEDAKSVPSGNAAPRRILPDGTYATESSYTVQSNTTAKLDAVKSATKPPLRGKYYIYAHLHWLMVSCSLALLLVNGDYFLGSVLATTLVKLVLRYTKLVSDPAAVNARRAEAMLIMTSIIRVGQSQFVTHHIDEDSYDRIMQDLRVIGNRDQPVIDKVYLEDSRNAFARQIQAEEVGYTRFEL